VPRRSAVRGDGRGAGTVHHERRGGFTFQPLEDSHTFKRVEAESFPKLGNPGLDVYIIIIYILHMLELISMPDFEGFDWSGGNAEKNWERHQVTPAECEQIFFNSPLFVANDEKHSAKEKRYFVLGQSDSERELFAAFTMRKKQVRVISARDMHRKERAVYRSS